MNHYVHLKHNTVYQLYLHKIVPKSLVTRELQIKTTMRHLYKLNSMTKIKKMNNKYVGEDVEKLKPYSLLVEI